jgi:hypothetical protein
MAKKKVSVNTSKKTIRQMVDKNLESLLVKLDPEMAEKKIRKKIKRAGKLLVKGIKVKEKSATGVNEWKEEAISV